MKNYKMTKIEKEVFRVLKNRHEIGRKEYGEGIDLHQNTVYGWLDEAIEEAADMLQYLVAMRMKMKGDK